MKTLDSFVTTDRALAIIQLGVNISLVGYPSQARQI